MAVNQSDYVLGHTADEQQRLIRQARFLAPATEHFLQDAGIVSGMRVLDIGCGMGDVTMLVAQIVGPAGRVVSIDLDQASIDTAQERESAVGLDNTTFYQADILTFTDAKRNGRRHYRGSVSQTKVLQQPRAEVANARLEGIDVLEV